MFSFFLPVILKDGLNYSTSKAQLYTFPPYAVAMPVRLPSGGHEIAHANKK